MKLRNITTLSFIVFMLLLVPTLSRGQDEPRTYYDSLKLDTPENAAQTFIDAYQREDYPTVFSYLRPSHNMLGRPRLQYFRLSVFSGYLKQSLAISGKNHPALTSGNISIHGINLIPI